jgi:hypothetical protein
LHKKQLVLKSLLCLILSLSCVSCARIDKLASGDSDSTSDYYEHTVKWPEENLYNIVVWRTGNLDNYNEIRKINSKLTPYGLAVGSKVLIPQAMVSNKEPMPKFNHNTEQTMKKTLPTQPPGRTYFLHRVTIPGESLSIIAKWYTGDLKKWEQLAEANPNLNPNRINIGDEILIPEDMMIKKDPITKSFVDSFAPKSRSEKVVSEPESETEPPPPQPEPIVEETDIELVPPKF